MAFSDDVHSLVDSWLDTVRPALRDRQSAYIASRGGYFQGLWTHTDLHEPKDGLSVAADNLLSRPTDQRATWSDFLPAALLPLVASCRLRFDIYSGPSGYGYTLTAQVMIGMEQHQRVIHVGLESYRGRDWYVEPLPTVM